MSAGSFGPTYSLYGVICHAGGGPNSGHYYAYVKNREGRWLEMNDEYVVPSIVPVNKKNAYMLFYIQNKGQGLEAAVNSPLLGIKGPATKNGLAAGMKKRVQRYKEAEEEDTGVKVDAKFIGPLLPLAEVTSTRSSSAPMSPLDPQAASLKAKIDAISKKPSYQAMAALDKYDSDDSSAKENESQIPSNEVTKDVKGKQIAVVEDAGCDVKSLRPSSPPPSSLPPSSPQFRPPVISPSRFYSNSSGNNKKRKMADKLEVNNRYQPKRILGPLQSQTEGYTTSNPFNKPITKKRRIGL